jgi:hypothetical protein
MEAGGIGYAYLFIQKKYGLNKHQDYMILFRIILFFYYFPNFTKSIEYFYETVYKKII